MIRIKYGWSVDAEENNMKLIYRIIKLNLSTMFDDLRNVIKISPKISVQANFYCCYELSRNNKIEMALNYFNNLNEKDKNECHEKLLNIFARILDDHNSNDNDENDQKFKNIFEFLKLITLKSSNNNDKQEFLQKLENIQLLRKKYHIKNLSYLDFDNKIKRELLFEKTIKNEIDLIKLQKFHNPLLKLWEITNELCKLLNLNEIYGFIEICKYLNNLQITCAIINYILETIHDTINDTELLIDFAILLISQHIINSTNDEGIII